MNGARCAIKALGFKILSSKIDGDMIRLRVEDGPRTLRSSLLAELRPASWISRHSSRTRCCRGPAPRGDP